MENGSIIAFTCIAFSTVTGSYAEEPHAFWRDVESVGVTIPDSSGREYFIEGRRIPYAFSITLRDPDGRYCNVSDGKEACRQISFRLVQPATIQALNGKFECTRPFYVSTSEMSFYQAALIERRSVEDVQSDTIIRLNELRRGDTGFDSESDRKAEAAIREYVHGCAMPIIGVDRSYASLICIRFNEKYSLPMTIPSLSEWFVVASDGHAKFEEAIPISERDVVWGKNKLSPPEEMLKYVIPSSCDSNDDITIKNIFGNVSEYVILTNDEQDRLDSLVRRTYGEVSEHARLFRNKILATAGLSVGGDVLAAAGYKTRSESWNYFRTKEAWNARDLVAFRRVEGGSVLWTERTIATGFRPIIACPRGEFRVRERREQSP